MAHNEKIKDCDAFFEVNPITRQIINKTPNKIVLMQGDHNSERFTFSLPRYIEGHDMAESAKAYLHYVNPTKPDSGEPPYEMNDLRIDPDDAEKVICSWLISENATKEPGALSFLIEFECYDGDVLVYSWHTLPHTGISIGATFNFKEKIATQYADVLHQWEQRLFGLSDKGVQNIETAKSDALSTIGTTKENAKEEIEGTKDNIIDAIEKKGAEILETITDDYAALNAKVDNVKAECDKLYIVDKKAGELISLTDSTEKPLQSMKIFGKTTQAAEPTPDNPQELVSVGDSGSMTEYVTGKNWFNNDTSLLKTVAFRGGNGVSYERIGYEIRLPAGIYTFSLQQLIITDYDYVYGVIINDDNLIIRTCHLLFLGTDNATPLTITINEGEKLLIYNGADTLNVSAAKDLFERNQILLEADPVATEYEHFKEQTLTLLTPNGLAGVPVSSGGNYTDENGQQYACDEVDFKRGVYMQRVYKTTIKTIDSVSTHSNGQPFAIYICKPERLQLKGQASPVLSNRYSYKHAGRENYEMYGVQNNIVVNDERFTDVATANNILEAEQPEFMYILETPIETPLTDEEIEAYKALHTNYPNTTIYNSDGAYTEVEYMADTKNFIDGKFAALEAAILSTGGNV